MKSLRTAVLIAICFGGLNLLAQTPGQKSFDVMKSLTGNWEGKNAMGDSVAVSYRMTAGDSALMAEIQSRMQGKSEDMISMIHMDNGRLLLTHYCAAGNQPRMQASISPDGKTITFNFVDGTNIASNDTPHMRSVVFTFIDTSHHTEEWHFALPGKEMIERFDLERKS